MTQIVTTRTALPLQGAPGGLVYYTALPPAFSADLPAGVTFNMHSTRVVPISQAGKQSFFLNLAQGLDADVTCIVVNAAFTVHFQP